MYILAASGLFDPKQIWQLADFPPLDRQSSTKHRDRQASQDHAFTMAVKTATSYFFSCFCSQTCPERLELYLKCVGPCRKLRSTIQHEHRATYMLIKRDLPQVLVSVRKQLRNYIRDSKEIAGAGVVVL